MLFLQSAVNLHQKLLFFTFFVAYCLLTYFNVGYALEVMPVSTVLVNKVNRCWFSVLARLFHVSNNSVIDSYMLFHWYTASKISD